MKKNKERFIMTGEGIILKPKLSEPEQIQSDKLDKLLNIIPK